MENTAYRNAMELLARRRSQAEKDAALRREDALKQLPKAQKELLCRAWSAAGGPFSGA